MATCVSKFVINCLLLSVITFDDQLLNTTVTYLCMKKATGPHFLNKILIRQKNVDLK